jgi:hypothetical protein
MRPLDPAFLPVVVAGRFQEQTPSKHGLDQSLSGIAEGLLPLARVASVSIETAKMEECIMPSRRRVMLKVSRPGGSVSKEREGESLVVAEGRQK